MDRSFFKEESRRLKSYFQRRAPYGEEPEDLVQESFARLAGRARDRPLGNPASYLQRIARNLLIDRSRRRTAAAPLVSMDDVDPVLSTPARQEEEIEASDLMVRYEEAVRGLPPRTRQVFLLHRVGELSYGDIASRLSISIRTVEWHIGEALLRIRRTLDGR